MALYSHKAGRITVNKSGDIPEMPLDSDLLPEWWEEVRTVINRQREELIEATAPVRISFESSNPWNHSHNLGRYPIVQVMDESANIITPTIEHVSVNEVKVTHSGAVAGSIILY